MFYPVSKVGWRYYLSVKIGGIWLRIARIDGLLGEIFEWAVGALK